LDLLFFPAEDGIRARNVTGVQTCALPILTIFVDMIGGITVKADAMREAALQGFATATDLADYLVKKGLPFRDAHETVALAVRQRSEERRVGQEGRGRGAAEAEEEGEE